MTTRDTIILLKVPRTIGLVEHTDIIALYSFILSPARDEVLRLEIPQNNGIISAKKLSGGQ